MSQQQIHTLILDAGPIINDVPPASTLRSRATCLITHPSVLNDEIRDAATRSRVETTLKPFLEIRQPRAESVKVIQDFARKTGDLQVLSSIDVALLALTYEVECERNGGDWRLRKYPGEKLNMKKKVPETQTDATNATIELDDETAGSVQTQQAEASGDNNVAAEQDQSKSVTDITAGLSNTSISDSPPKDSDSGEFEQSHQMESDVPEQSGEAVDSRESPTEEDLVGEDDEADEDDDDGGEWITPSNVHRHVAAGDHMNGSKIPAKQAKEPAVMQSALLTADFAVQNVALSMNLNLVSTVSTAVASLPPIRNLRTTLPRCHSCFYLVRSGSNPSASSRVDFCPRCGKPTLTRVTVTTDPSSPNGLRLHLKRNMQWNTRGDRYTIPKPTTGNSSGKVSVQRDGRSGGKGGWGKELILAEDQKEYVRARAEEERRSRKLATDGLWDEDILPGILTGRRDAGARIKVGAGRNVNSKKRR